MTKITRIILIALVIMAVSQLAFAFESTVSLRGGLTMSKSDFDGTDDTHGNFGLSYEAWLKDYLSVGIAPYLTRMGGERDVDKQHQNGNYEATLFGADLLVKYRPTKKAVIDFEDCALTRIAPYANLGLGLASFSSEGYIQPVWAGAPRTDYDESGLAFMLPTFGVGVSFMTKWNLNMDLGLQLVHSLNDKIDNLEEDDMNDGFLNPYLSVGYTFGGKKDDSSARRKPTRILRNYVTMEEDFSLKGVQFEFDSDKLTNEAQDILKEVVDAMQKSPKVKLDIQGHTDNVGTDKYNNDLSLRRAESVKKFLVSNGIDEARLTTQGFGSSQPIATNDTEEGRAENRRIEFVIVK